VNHVFVDDTTIPRAIWT